jgi:hypothetical protein
MYDERELVCYILVRTDLPSMNPGKAMSQCHHAGVQMVVKHSLHILVQEYVNLGLEQGADHFNTTIVLGATGPQITGIMDAVLGKLKSEIAYDRVIDPSYPFFVESMEIANLIPQDDATKIIKVMDNGKVLMVRPELTCAWFVGDRNDVKFTSIFEGLSLHP